MAVKRFTYRETAEIGDRLGADWSQFDLKEFRMGLNVELEHGKKDPATDITHNDPILTGKIVLVHLKECPDYYTRLARMKETIQLLNGEGELLNGWKSGSRQ